MGTPTTVNWGIDRTVTPHNAGVFDDANVFQNVFTVTAISGVVTVPVASGGTGRNTLAANGVLIGEGTGAVNITAAMTNGQLLVGQTGADPLPETVSGDATLAASGALTLATVNANVGSFGSSTAIPNFTVNAKGLVTAAGTNVVIAPAGTLTGTTLASNVVTSSLTTVGTIGTGVWQGTPVALAFGGTNANLTAVNNALVTSTGSAMAISQTPTLGTNSGTGGQITFNGATSGSVALRVAAAAGTSTIFQLPATNGTASNVLQTDGSGNGSWVAASVPLPQGRLTLTSATPVLTATVTAAGTVYYTPYLGGFNPLWNGSVFAPVLTSELSNILANSSVGSAGPAAAVASSVYDLFIWNNAGTPTLTRGPVWTNTTTRSAGTAIARVNGILVNSIAITNGPGANAGTYVGSIATDGGGGTVTVNFGGSASGGVAGVLNVWNMYNRVVTLANSVDNGAAYTYSSATIRQARASAGNQVTYLSGIPEDSATVSYVTTNSTVATASSFLIIGVGFNNTAAFNSSPQYLQTAAAVAITGGLSAALPLAVRTGVSVLSANEGGDGTHTCQFNTSSANTFSLTFRM